MLDAAPVQRREEVDRADAGGHELGAVGPVGRIGAAEREPISRRPSVVVDARGVGTGREEARDKVVVAALHGDVEGRRPRERGCVRIRARVEQVLDDRAVAADGCRPQR